MAAPKRPVARRLFDVSAVPGGPQGQFGRQLISQLDQDHAILNLILREVESAPEAIESAPRGYFPRVSAAPTTSDPRALDWDEIGTLFGDEGATETTLWLLPDPATYPRDLQEEAPWFRFCRTTDYAMRIQAAAGSTIEVDLAPASADGGTVDLTDANSVLLLVLHDDRWRGTLEAGAFEIDA